MANNMIKSRRPDMGAINAVKMGAGLRQKDVDSRKCYYRALAWHKFNIQNGEKSNIGCMHCRIARQSEEVRALLTTHKTPATAVEENRDEPSGGRRSIISFVDSFSY
jgi:hypothetical protein